VIIRPDGDITSAYSRSGQRTPHLAEQDQQVSTPSVIQPSQTGLIRHLRTIENSLLIYEAVDTHRVHCVLPFQVVQADSVQRSRQPPY
jgi:hypothetical protein